MQCFGEVLVVITLASTLFLLPYTSKKISLFRNIFVFRSLAVWLKVSMLLCSQKAQR